MTTTKLYAWTTEQLGVVADVVAGPWNLWLRDWGLQEMGPLRCRAATPDDAAVRWLPAVNSGERRIWLAAQSQQTLEAALFALPHPSKAEAARSVSAAAFADLRSAIVAALELVPADMGLREDEPATSTWSGSVAVELPLAARPLLMMLNALCVAAIAPAPKTVRTPGDVNTVELIAPQAAMSGQILRLKVELSACELDIGTLQSLRVGDVLPLPHSLESPARVLAAGNQHVCDAYLGRQGSRKAAELTRSRP